MADFPYTTVSARIRHFLEKIPDTGRPDKITQKELEARGFKTKNDRTIIPVLKALKLLSSDGGTTENWQAFRNRGTNRALLAQLVRETYGDLFHVYPDAHQRSDGEIRDFMSSKTRAGERAVQYMVATFKSLASLADFGAPPVEVASTNGSAAEGAPGNHHRAAATKTVHSVGIAPQIHINLQIQIPDTADDKKIDAIFKSMATHLFGREGSD